VAVAGTPNASPSAPSGATIQAAVGASNPYIVLANVLVGTSVTQINSSNITDLRTMASLGPSNLSSAAITLGYAQITSTFNATSTSAVQVTGLTAAVTIPSGNRRIKITAFSPALFDTASGSHAEMSIWDGTVGSGTQLTYTAGYNTNSNSWHGGYAVAVVTPPAGSKTYNVGLLVFTTGTAQITASASGPSFILVEAI